MDGISVLQDEGKWAAASVLSVLCILFNGLTVTQSSTLETDGYPGGKVSYNISRLIIRLCVALSCLHSRHAGSYQSAV